jgi:hypothetical protein
MYVIEMPAVGPSGKPSYWTRSAEHGTGWIDRPKQAFSPSELAAEIKWMIEHELSGDWTIRQVALAWVPLADATPASDSAEPPLAPSPTEDVTVAKPCPFCGHTDLKILDAVVLEGRIHCHAHCLNCGCLGPACSTTSAAIRWWGSRYIDGKIVRPSERA